MKKTAAILLIITLFIGETAFAQRKKQSASDHNFEISKSLDIYNSVLRELNMFYVDTIQPGKLVIESIEDMLENLDPYTSYIPEEETKDFKFMTTGEYGGVGAVIAQNKGKEIYVSEPYEGMPAQRNGLKAGDIIVEVDGVKLKDKSVSDVSELLKGQPGTEVKVTLKRPDEKAEFVKTITREKIQINPVGYYGVVGTKTGYILLNQFTDKAADEVKKAILDLKNNHSIESLVLDLRNNPGGLLDQAVSITNFFIPQGQLILSTRGKIKQMYAEYRTKQSPILPDMPLVVLVNNGSASASEIVAGAVQDLDRAVVVGTRSYGKGLVQATREVSYNGYLKVTTAKYYTPSGRCIQAIDYAHRNDDGSIARIPDSLTHEFKTKNGRTVKDGGGVMPDVEVKNEQKMNISYYLYADNMIFDFATQYATKHKKIAAPEQFGISNEDYNDFKTFLKNRDFTYKLKSAEYLEKFKEVFEYEGYDDIVKNEYDSLKSKLTNNIERDVDLFRPDIEKLINAEIVKRYFFQKGTVRYALKDDPELQKALEILSDKTKYNSLLQPQSAEK